ncbi:MAG: alpha-galactosidase [Gemmatimonadetes bacterium]|nr:alpha-galactosidase [Gemmatimonadota bacterium]
MTSRREFVQRSALSAVGLSLPGGASTRGRDSETTSPGRRRAFLDLRRPPDVVMVQTEEGDLTLRGTAEGRWESAQVAVAVTEVPGGLRVRLSSPSSAVLRMHLRWRGDLSATRLVLGDAWERSYGDLEWRGFVPDRVMPWYCALWDGEVADGYGVRTRPAAFCFWQADTGGITLWADVRSGGSGVHLGERELTVCDVACREGQPGESPFSALRAFCGDLCPDPRLTPYPVYGHNDWYWAYGNNSAASVLDDAHRIVELSPTGENRPFTVIDDGWQPDRGRERSGRGLWNQGNEKFPDMARLAGDVRAAGARPGIWIRPLLAPRDVPDAWKLARDARILDPTVPDTLRKVADDIARLRQWGYGLIKHDYTTFDVFGRWGFQMGASMTDGRWTFAAGRGRTTAEVLSDLYDTIRTAADDALVIGCNTVSHLSAGVFEMCRIGDDTSGQDWSRTRRMGVNTLAFRAVQHGALYGADPDCVGVTRDIPWSFNRQWLDLVARSGTTLFVSIASDALGPEQRRDLQAALTIAALEQPLGEPSDWLHTIWPTRWRLAEAEHLYDWIGADGITEVPS